MRSVVVPDDHTFPFVIKLCSDFNEVKKGLEVHGLLIKLEFDYDVFVNNRLMLFYGSFGDLVGARKVFDEMLERDLVSWNSVIRVFSDSKCHFEAIGMFRKIVLLSEFKPNVVSVVSVLPVYAVLEDGIVHVLESFKFMVSEGWKVNWTTISSLLPVLVELGKISKGREVHGFCLRRDSKCDVFVANALIDMYAKLERSAEASAVFHKMGLRNVVSWNTMVASSAQNRLELEVIRLVREMQSCGKTPTSVTLTNVLPASAQIGCLRSGKEIHAMSVINGSANDLFVSNANLYVRKMWLSKSCTKCV
ncbi:hypothetical protein K7X08_014080 [Anisodus acutangulus]|uniref:Pentatricopeptide repeat-containing protein n=1 Tax=Anisodus acutangulus TaxID=402998 RepID=A0A9Q1R2R1_9SOLA|nr:hypothetical protein K7X08_014080 [Anisodus acutangulus]